MPVGVLVVDRSGSTYYVNKMAKTICGMTREDFALELLTERFKLFVRDSKTNYPVENLPVVRVHSWAAPVYNSDGTIEYAISAFAGIGSHINSFSEARLASQWNPEAPDENTAYYLKRLDEFARHSQPLRCRPPAGDHRDDGQCDVRGSGGLPGGRHGRLGSQAGQKRNAPGGPQSMDSRRSVTVSSCSNAAGGVSVDTMRIGEASKPNRSSGEKMSRKS